MNVKFLAFYDLDQYKDEKRINPLSARNVVDYISDCLIHLGCTVEVISPSETLKEEGSFKRRKTYLTKEKTVVLGPTIGSKRKIAKNFFKLITRMWFIVYLLKNVKKEDTIFVWSQIPLILPVNIFLHLCPCKNRKVWCVGELYQKVNPEKLSASMKDKEIRFIEKGDKFILSTNGIKKYVDIREKESIVLPGVLRGRTCDIVGFNDGRIHVVYSGVLNNNKGVNQAIDLAEMLPEDYCIHILGWSNETGFVEEMINRIDAVGNSNKATIVFDGLLRGDEYDNFLSKCDIGICSQNCDSEYNDCSFPSKILAYLCNGLRVVCSDVSAVKESSIASLITFYEGDKVENLAKAILGLDLTSSYDSIRYIKTLDKQFEKELGCLLYK